MRTGYDVTPAETRTSLKPYAERPGWADLKAVKTGEISAIETRLGRTLYDFTAIEYIAKRLYPEQLRMSTGRDLKAYHEKYLPVAFSGTWMLPLKP